jgi:hypothetical protein
VYLPLSQVIVNSTRFGSGLVSVFVETSAVIGKYLMQLVSQTGTQVASQLVHSQAVASELILLTKIKKFFLKQR